MVWYGIIHEVPYFHPYGIVSRQRETTGDNGRPRETTGGNGRPRETMGDHGRPQRPRTYLEVERRQRGQFPRTGFGPPTESIPLPNPPGHLKLRLFRE